jgi:hypothetical protein
MGSKLSISRNSRKSQSFHSHTGSRPPISYFCLSAGNYWFLNVLIRSQAFVLYRNCNYCRICFECYNKLLQIMFVVAWVIFSNAVKRHFDRNVNALPERKPIPFNNPKIPRSLRCFIFRRISYGVQNNRNIKKNHEMHTHTHTHIAKSPHILCQFVQNCKRVSDIFQSPYSYRLKFYLRR